MFIFITLADGYWKLYKDKFTHNKQLVQKHFASLSVAI